MRVKPCGKIYSVNEGNEAQWDDVVKAYIASKKHPKVRLCHTSQSYLRQRAPLTVP